MQIQSTQNDYKPSFKGLYVDPENIGKVGITVLDTVTKSTKELKKCATKDDIFIESETVAGILMNNVNVTVVSYLKGIPFLKSSFIRLSELNSESLLKKVQDLKLNLSQDKNQTLNKLKEDSSGIELKSLTDEASNDSCFKHLMQIKSKFKYNLRKNYKNIISGSTMDELTSKYEHNRTLIESKKTVNEAYEEFFEAYNKTDSWKEKGRLDDEFVADRKLIFSRIQLPALEKQFQENCDLIKAKTRLYVALKK